MADQSPQNFDNHVRHDKFLYVYLGILAVALILGCVGLVSPSRVLTVSLLLTCLATVCVAINARQYGVKVQNRVIRLEMHLRLEKLLDGDLAGRIGELGLSQLIGLRFASDDELPELTKKVLDENITKVNDVKKLVKDWQPDHLRV